MTRGAATKCVGIPLLKGKVFISEKKSHFTFGIFIGVIWMNFVAIAKFSKKNYIGKVEKDPFLFVYVMNMQHMSEFNIM